MNRFNGNFSHIVRYGDFELYLGQKIHHVFGTSVEFRVPFLPAKTLGFGHRKPVDAGFGQRFAHLVELERFDDSNYEFAYQYREGKDINPIWGYECLGFFQSDEEVANSPSQTALGGGVPKPGDLKYKDQNGDNIIDSKDQIALGRFSSPFAMGINLTAKYKNFTLFVLGTGSLGGENLKKSDYYWISGEEKYSKVVRGRWTPETAETATYPRLTTGNGNNNFTNSDFWMYKTNRFDLAKIQLTYDFPAKMLRGKLINALSIYASGANLLTISKEREHLETNVGSAPQTRFYNLGVKVAF